MGAVARGVAIAPGVSLNGRLYTTEAIRKAHDRLAERIADPTARAVVMRTHHGAGDDSTRIVGQVTKVSLDETGALRYEAPLADTDQGRTIAKLAGKAAKDGKPFLGHVSIFGYWVGPTRSADVDGRTVETADDLEIDALDFTFSPGVPAASVTVENATSSGPSHESADPGRVPITESFEGEVIAAEAYATVTLDSGPLTVTISAYGVAPGDLDAIAKACSDAATQALAALDPDEDGDIDVPGAPSVDTDDDSQESSHREEPAVGETTTQAAETGAPAPITLTAEQLQALVSGAVAEALKAATPAAPAVEGAPVTEPAGTTAEPTPTRESLKAEILAELKESGVIPVARAGYGVAGVTSAEPATAEEIYANRGAIWANARGQLSGRPLG